MKKTSNNENTTETDAFFISTIKDASNKTNIQIIRRNIEKLCDLIQGLRGVAKMAKRERPRRPSGDSQETIGNFMGELSSLLSRKRMQLSILLIREEDPLSLKTLRQFTFERNGLPEWNSKTGKLIQGPMLIQLAGYFQSMYDFKAALECVYRGVRIMTQIRDEWDGISQEAKKGRETATTCIQELRKVEKICRPLWIIVSEYGDTKYTSSSGIDPELLLSVALYYPKFVRNNSRLRNAIKSTQQQINETDLGNIIAYRKIYRKRKERGKKRCACCKRTEELEEKFRKCSGCTVVYYCKLECQRNHWLGGHKHACKGG